jgi:N-acetylglucosamine kinase-like BadF-type ATPase
MSYFLAIDAGGTKTQCLLADETQVLARASTSTVKLMRVGEAEATTRLQAMLSDLSVAAGVSLAHITRTCFGLAGLRSPAVRAWAERAVAAVVAGELMLCGDEEIALDAAFGAGPGILVVAGTGSNAVGRAITGEIVGAGGWGPVLGDEGSGTWIGLEAIHAALAERDREPSCSLGCESSSEQNQNRGDFSGNSSSLLGEIARHWKLDSLGELVAFANHRGDAHQAAPDFASLAPVVARCAEQADAVAADVLRRAGEELAEQVALVAKKMSASKIEVAFTGSVLAQIAVVRSAMIAQLAILLPAAQIRPSAVDALDGALWRARRSGSPAI